MAKAVRPTGAVAPDIFSRVPLVHAGAEALLEETSCVVPANWFDSVNVKVTVTR